MVYIHERECIYAKNEQQYVLQLLRCSMGVGEPHCIPPELDVSELAETIRRSGILATVYKALCDFPNAQVMLTKEYYTIISQSVNQEYEGRRIINAFSTAGIQCIGLKGWDIRKKPQHVDASNVRCGYLGTSI